VYENGQHPSFRAGALAGLRAPPFSIGYKGATHSVLTVRLKVNNDLFGRDPFCEDGEFDNEDALALGAFQDFKTTIPREKNSRMLLKNGWKYFLILVQLGRVASFFTNHYSVSGGHLLPWGTEFI
jgi:hypothetical protein